MPQMPPQVIISNRRNSPHTRVYKLNTIQVGKWGDDTWGRLDPLIFEGIRRHMGWRNTPVLLWLRRIIEWTKAMLRWLRAKWIELTLHPVVIVYLEDPPPIRMEKPLAQNV